MEKGNTSITPESIPEASVLRELYADVRQADKMTIKFSKEEFESMLDDNNIPQQLQSLCTRLGVHIKVNRKTRTFELSGTGTSAEDMRAFKAVAVDVVYGGDEVAEKAFGMTPRERLAALIDYESSARRIRNKDAALMNYEIQLAKHVLREKYGISTDGIMEQLRRQAAKAFTSRERMERIAEVTDWFDKILSERYEDKLTELAERRDELNDFIANKNQQDFPNWEFAEEAYRQELGEIQEKLSSYTRLKALQEITPKAIFDEILDKYSRVAAVANDTDAFVNALLEEFRLPGGFVRKNLAWYKDQIQKVIDNFPVLRDEACRELETSELVRININLIDAVDTRNEKKNEEENTDGEEEDDVNGIENQYKENWMYEYDTVSNWSKMSARVRHMLYKCPLGDRLTRFGTEKHMPVMQVVNTLIQEMQGVTNSRDMEFVLKMMEKDYPWVQYIREQIAGEPRLKTELFLSIRRYAQQLGILQKSTKQSERDDASKNKLLIINSGSTKNTILSAAQHQIASGVPANKKMSIYQDEELDLDNVQKLLDIYDEYGKDDLDEIAKTNAEDAYDLLDTYPELLADLRNILTAIGFNITENDIRVVIAHNLPKGSWGQKNNLAFLLGNARAILRKIKDNGYKTIDDLLNESQNIAWDKKVIDNYRNIAQALTLADNGTVEASVRENGKVRYSFVSPSVLDDLMVGFQGKAFSREKSEKYGHRVNKTKGEFVREKYGNDPRFASVDENGNIHYRNFFLKMLTAGVGFPQYVTVLNTDKTGREKVEQKDLTQQDRLNMVWSMYHMDNAPYDNAKGIWFPIPLPSDSGRIGFINFFTSLRAERKEAIKESIIKELERMTETDSNDHLPETYRKNKEKFCTFPVLNNPELNGGYEVSDILDEFRTAQATGQNSTLDITLEDLVAAVMDSMVKKFQEENEAFYKAKVKEVGQEDVDDWIIEESVFQMAINELLNGDPAYYTGYNSGSDNIQKRAKQSIVPLNHPDFFNEDFLEAYKAYHGIDHDEELDEEDIVEHVLYITDPKIPSPSYADLESLYLDALNDGIIDRETYEAFLKSSDSIKYTDGQAFRSFDSMVMMMYALGEMQKGDDLDLALHRIAEGKQQPGDSFIVRTALKPFLSGLVPIEEADGTTRLMPVQHKLSEQILTAALVQARGTKLGTSPALNALARVMKEQHLDVAIFTSGVKAGNNGAVNFGDLDVENATEDAIVEKIYDDMAAYRNLTGRSIIHEIPYSLYGIVAQNPDTEMDNSEVPIGVQLQKLIAADLPDKVKTRVFENGGWQTHYEEATYPVEGVGNLTRSEILSLYNKLMTEKILRAYKEMTGTFADKAQLSEALRRSCRNSSRNSAYLERAFSLDEYGNFVIPLCDLATLNMSSEFLNSIVKNSVSRITMPGKQLVSMSAFGLAKDLKIEFERDEDGYPIRYSGIDCLLPAWSRHIVAKCTNADGVLDFSKLEKESPMLLRLIALRIPTQFKNFILPLKCVGFLPTILGDTIVTAIDNVPLLDADFDNDKEPTMFPSFEAQYYEENWENKIFNKEYKEYCDKWYDFDALHADFKEYMAMRKREGIPDNGYEFKDFYHERLDDEDFEDQYRRPDAPEGKPMPLWQYKKLHGDKYLLKDGPKLVYTQFDPNKPLSEQSEGAINNGIISVMYGMLTGKAVSTMSLAVGSTEKFDPIIKLLRDTMPQPTYPDSPADIATRVAQETRNNDGKQMIAVFANAEAMQAMLQHTNLSLRPGRGVTINGRTLESLHDVNIEDSLEYISRYIGTSLGAAADNAKDPKLSIMNINLRTAPVVSLMLQLGYTMEEVAMFLNIPSIRHYTDTGNFGDYGEPKEVHQFLPGGKEEMLDAIAFGDNYRDMDDDMADYCDTALSVFMYLTEVGERMRALSSLARGDSGGTAPHGPIENNLVRYLNYELFSEAESGEDAVFLGWQDIINYSFDRDVDVENEVNNAANPLAQAYITYGVVGAFKELSKYYPGIGDPNFRRQVKDIIKKYYNGVATTTNVKNIMYSMYDYVMSSYDCMRKEGYTFEESRNYYLNYFPEEAAMLVASYPDIANSLLFRRLKLYSTMDTNNPFISLEYEGTMLPETRDEFTAVWQQLFNAQNEDGTPNHELRELALDLFKYSYFRNGFRFSDGTFAHLAPAEARLEFPGYVEMLEDMQVSTSVMDFNNFELQFIRNNLYDRRFCQTVPTEVRKPDGWMDKDGNPAEVLTIKYRSKMSDANQKAYEWYFAGNDERETPRTAFVITQRQSGGGFRHLYYMKVSDNDVTGESTYMLTTPLGWKDRAVEYSAKENGVSMPSVFEQEDVAMQLRRKGKGKGRGKPKTKAYTNEARSTSTSENSSEEPNGYSEEDPGPLYKGFHVFYYTGEGYKLAQELYPDTVNSKKFKDARASYLKSQKSKTPGKATAKSKAQVAREKNGGRKADKRFRIIESDSKTGSVIYEEAKCAQEVGAYTICITDKDSGQLAIGIHSATPMDSHFVGDEYNIDNVYDIANALRGKLARKKVKSVVLNLTGSYMNTIGKYATQEDLDAYALKIYNAIKDNGIFVSKVVTTAQPGMPLASARAAMKLGYVVEVHPTPDYKVYDKVGEKAVADKDTFMGNLSSSLMSDEGKKDSRVYDKEEGPFITAKNKWTREIASKDKKTLYVFTDNTDRTSGSNKVAATSRYGKKYGGRKILTYPNTTSAVIRGLENAFPLSTQKKFSQGNTAAGQWQDSDLSEFRRVISDEINDIIEAFESGEYRRVVLPMGGVFDGPISGITKERTPKLYRELTKQMEYLQDSINEIADTMVSDKKEEDDFEPGFKVDNNDTLSGDEIQQTSFAGSDISNSNVFTVDINDLAENGIGVYDESGIKIKDSKLFIVLPKGKQTASSEHFSKGKIYSSSGKRVISGIEFQLKSSKTKYNLLEAQTGGVSLAISQGIAKNLVLTDKMPYNKRGLVWLDDNNEPIC